MKEYTVLVNWEPDGGGAAHKVVASSPRVAMNVAMAWAGRTMCKPSEVSAARILNTA